MKVGAQNFWLVDLLLAGAIGLIACAPHTGRFAALIPHSHILEKSAPAPSASLSLRLTYNDISVLLPADSMEGGMIFSLEHFGDQMPSTILKMPHHGIWQSNLPALLDRLRPKLAIVSASSRDPTPEVLALYQMRSIPVVATRDRGDIFVETDGRVFRVYSAR